MQDFYMIIKKEYVCLYEKTGNGFERVYLNGHPEYAYSINHVKDTMEELLKVLQDEYNLETSDELGFTVVENEDRIVTESVVRELGTCVGERIGIERLVEAVMKGLRTDRKLFIDEYGVNFDGTNYVPEEKGIGKNRFSLLGLTIGCDELLKYGG